VSRLRPGDLLAGLAGALLLFSLFQPWYVPPAPDAPDAPGVSGWQAFAVIDILLAAAALLGIALTAVTVARRTPTLPVALSVLSVLVGAVATLLVLVRIVNQPGDNEALDVTYGAWLALAGAVGLTAGGWWATADERNRGVPAPRVEVRPTPPPGPAAS
jgi:uncharacterized membrane protein